MEGHSDDEEDKNDRAGRVTATVHGDTVDLTDTGIDPTFLEALPDELREEALLSQQLNAQMSRQARGIVPDFLNVLPRSLRTELQQFDAPASHSAPASRQTDDQPQERHQSKRRPARTSRRRRRSKGPVNQSVAVTRFNSWIAQVWRRSSACSSYHPCMLARLFCTSFWRTSP